MLSSDDLREFLKSFIFWMVIAIVGGTMIGHSTAAIYGYDEEMNSYQSLSEQLVGSRSLFVSKQDSIQSIAANLLDEKDGFRVYRANNGTAFVEQGGALVPAHETDMSDELLEFFDDLFTPIDAPEDEAEDLEYKIMLTVVRPYGLEFYTGFSEENGFSGILYEVEAGEHGNYSVMELVENWQLFYEGKSYA